MSSIELLFIQKTSDLHEKSLNIEPQAACWEVKLNGTTQKLT